jgi:hypothetical protein
MATNVYEHRDTTWYGGYPRGGKDLWGWTVLTSSDGRSVAFFGTKKIMNCIVRDLRAKLRELDAFKSADEDEMEAAVLIIMTHECGSDDDYNFMDDIFGYRLSDKQTECIHEMFETFGTWLRTQDLLGR